MLKLCELLFCRKTEGKQIILHKSIFFNGNKKLLKFPAPACICEGCVCITNEKAPHSASAQCIGTWKVLSLMKASIFILLPNYTTSERNLKFPLRVCVTFPFSRKEHLGWGEAERKLRAALHLFIKTSFRLIVKLFHLCIPRSALTKIKACDFQNPSSSWHPLISTNESWPASHGNEAINKPGSSCSNSARPWFPSW